MKLTKTTFVLMAITGLMALSPLARAQTNAPASGTTPPAARRNGAMNVDNRMNRMDRELKLTDAQKPKVKAVLEAQNEKTRELRNDTSLSREARREKAQALQQEASSKLKGILTPEQYTKYDGMVSQAKQRMAEGAGANSGTNNAHGAHGGTGAE
jgi:Spy/CpxP family protein refolding chaperone